MQRQKNGSFDLEELTYLACDQATRLAFEGWIAGMTPERDGECGIDHTDEATQETIPGFLTWIREHNASTAFDKDGLFQTFIWRSRATGEILATGTIAPDDRGVKEQYKLGGDGLWGGVNVRFDRRYEGIGSQICARIDEHIQQATNASGQPKLFHLFTANPSAEAIYEKLGFSRNPIGEINTAAFGEERLWSKKYEPLSIAAN